jgi:hypothetical protein
MARVGLRIGARERLHSTISKATPLGLLPTVAIVEIGTTSIGGTATVMRTLADALVQAAELADAYDADPDAFNQREQAERATDPYPDAGGQARRRHLMRGWVAAATASTRPAHTRKGSL